MSTTTTRKVRDLATDLRRASLKAYGDRLLTVTFSKTASPARINDGAGWPHKDAVEYLHELELSAIDLQSDDQAMAFRQKARTGPLGDIKIDSANMPAGIHLTLVAAS